MEFVQRITHPLMAGIFLIGGLDAVRDPEPKIPKADYVVASLSKVVGTSVKTQKVIQANGLLQMGAATGLAMGILPRCCAAVLAGSLIPTTIAGHRFWEEKDDDARSAQQIHFLKNLAIIGGLLCVVIQPSKGRSGRAKTSM